MSGSWIEARIGTRSSRPDVKCEARTRYVKVLRTPVDYRDVIWIPGDVLRDEYFSLCFRTGKYQEQTSYNLDQGSQGSLSHRK